MSNIKTSDVTAFIKDMVEQTMVYEVDERGYVIQKSNGEQITISSGGASYPLVIYQEVMTDQSAEIINPLAEGLGSTPASLWFYEKQKSALLGRIFTIFLTVMKAALDEKKSKKDKENHIPMEILAIASKIIDDVDEKLISEFKTLTEDRTTNEFLTIYYQRKQLRCVLRCGLFDVESSDLQPWRAKFPKIRRKTWEILEKLTLAILGINDKDDISKFTKKADEISCARLSSFLNVLLSVYREINPILEIIDSDISIDLSKFAHHLNRLSAYADNAKFMVQPSRGSGSTQATSTSVVPGPTTIVPGPQPAWTPGGYVPSPANQPGVTLVPGPVYADGRMSPPTPVMATGAHPQPMSYGTSQPPPYGMPPPPYGGYPPQQQGYQPPYGVPFAGPYLPAAGYPGDRSMSINLLPPGAPPGFNPNYR